MPEELRNALLQLRDAFTTLNRVWDEQGEDGENLFESYPFGTDFGNQTASVMGWVNKHTHDRE